MIICITCVVQCSWSVNLMSVRQIVGFGLFSLDQNILRLAYLKPDLHAYSVASMNIKVWLLPENTLSLFATCWGLLLHVIRQFVGSDLRSSLSKSPFPSSAKILPCLHADWCFHWSLITSAKELVCHLGLSLVCLSVCQQLCMKF